MRTYANKSNSGIWHFLNDFFPKSDIGQLNVIHLIKCKMLCSYKKFTSKFWALISPLREILFSKWKYQLQSAVKSHANKSSEVPFISSFTRMRRSNRDSNSGGIVKWESCFNQIIYNIISVSYTHLTLPTILLV